MEALRDLALGRRRPHDRARPGRPGLRRLRHQGPVRRGGRRPRSHRSRQAGTQALDANGIPLGAVAAPANRHDAPLLAPTLATLDDRDLLAPGATVHLDRGYDADRPWARPAARGRRGEIARKGRPAPIPASRRWPVEPTNAWTNAHKTLVWCIERRAAAVACWLAFSATVIVLGRLVRQGWLRYRWDGRPRRRP